MAVSPRDVQRDGGTGPLARRQRRAVLLKGVLFGETALEVGALPAPSQQLGPSGKAGGPATHPSAPCPVSHLRVPCQSPLPHVH